MNEVPASAARLFGELVELFFALMGPGDWIALVFGVVMAVIASTAAVIAWSARQQAKRSAGIAEQALGQATRSADAAEGSVRLQSRQLDAALKPGFELTPDEQPYERDRMTHWRLLVRMAAGPPMARLRWSISATGKGPREGIGQPVYWAPATTEYGPLDASVGDRFAAPAIFPTLVDLVEVEATVTVWSEELDDQDGTPTGRSWPLWRQTIEFGPKPPPRGTRIIV